MAKFFSLIFKIIFTLPIVAFLFFITLENRETSLSLIWSPIHEATILSLPVIIFAFLVIGFVWGSLILWSNSLEMRAENRALKKEILSLENRMTQQKNEHDRAKAAEYSPPAAPLPVPRVAIPEIL